MFLLLLNFTMMHMVIYESEDNFHKTGPDKAPILNLSTWKYSYPSAKFMIVAIKISH